MSLSAEDIAARVIGILVDEFEIDSSVIRVDSNLREDLGLDSLDGVDLVVALEKTFHCRISEDEAREIETVGQIYSHIASLLESAEPGVA